ncbi:hypothetical protein SAMN03159496_02226 [Rhizobium sp. NFR07]|uniref:hypothetical protein n=1 Tax=Rhizobium sp. NFR07 TaxID=1566262 RepID=UPI0008E64607|nr:hypothetical protein [Rhizobium sp. NFR07]SFB18607.1 hypothetical protein SAMN03159496_02226 [Rhizobium sp. NFR07]
MTVTSAADDRGAPSTAGQAVSSAASRRTAVYLMVAALASLIPILSVRFPPMTDYANHYVRMWLLAGGIERPHMAQFYEIDWNVAWTNIAIDLVAAGLGKIVSMDVIGPLVLGLAALLPAVGVALLNRRLFGGFHWWQLLCFILAWNAVFLFGFISFLISLGLALIFAYVDQGLKGRGWAVTFASRAVSAALLLVAHPFGLLFYTALLAALEFGPSLAPFRTARALLGVAGRVVVAIAPVFVPLAIFLLFGPSLPGQKDVSLFDSMYWVDAWSLRRALLLLTYFTTYDLRVDFLYLLLMFVVVRETIRRDLIRVHWGLVLAAIATAIVAVFVPTLVFDTGAIDRRLPCMAVLAAVAGLRPDVRGRLQSLMLPAILLVVLSRIAFVEYVWLQRAADVRSVEAALQQVPPGSAVLPLLHEIHGDNINQAPIGRMVAGVVPSFWHYPAIVSLERDAFMPYLFTAPGKQPLRVRAPWNEIAVPEAIPFPVHLLNVPENRLDPYMSDWKNRFDYALVMNADMESPLRLMPRMDNLHLIADEGFARLYRIDHPQAPKP